MKKSLRAIGCAVLVTALACSATVLAQRRGGGGRGAGVRGAVAVPSAQGTLLLFAALLDLTDAQQTQVRSVFNAAEDAAEQIAQPTPSRSIFDAVKAGASDDDIRGMASQAGTRATALTVLQAQTFGKVWALLTDTQKTKVDVTMYDDIGQFLARPPSSAGLR